MRAIGLVTAFAAAAAYSMMTCGATSSTISVASGCPAPPATPNHNTYYVDPVNGSMSGDGSKAHPWQTLAEVFDVRNKLIANAPATYLPGYGIIQPNPNAPIKSGDVIYLMSGNHGSPSLQGWFGQANNNLYGYNNTDFITVAAAPGQTPVISQLTLKGVNKWLFEGLTFQSLQNVPANHGQPFTTAAGLADYDLATLGGPNRNVIFDHNLFMSQADTSSWTTYDWLSKRVSGLVVISGSCFTITNNLFTNIGFGIGTQRSTDVLIQHNVINRFADDGIDFGSNNMVIDGNLIENSIEDNDGFHRDAMQGQPYGNVPVSKVEITNNLVMNQTQPLVQAADLQGIDSFDGVWQNLLVENNIVVTNAYHGITFYGATNIDVINNTVVGSNSTAVNTWIDINPSKTGQASQNVTVRNNIASYVAVNATNAIADHNIIATMNPSYIKYFHPYTGVSAAVLATSVFKTFQTGSFQYDMRLASSIAVNGGIARLAPRTDIRGYARGLRFDLGAVEYGGPPITALQ